jgi:hypothetical protein
MGNKRAVARLDLAKVGLKQRVKTVVVFKSLESKKKKKKKPSLSAKAFV